MLRGALLRAVPLLAQGNKPTLDECGSQPAHIAGCNANGAASEVEGTKAGDCMELEGRQRGYKVMACFGVLNSGYLQHPSRASCGKVKMARAYHKVQHTG